MAKRNILGIDFGTTNTAATFFDEAGKLRLVPVKDKTFVLPSVVWFRAADKVVVGHAARSQIIDDPRHTIFGVKRFLGRRYESEFVSRHKDRFVFDLMEGVDGYAAVEIYGQIISLGDVVHHLFKQIIAHANHVAGKTFTECVVTVPVHASIRQREATRKAAETAGIEVVAMINEPTAAALYYANLRNPESKVLVFDLGGGTFDATLMEIKNRAVKVLAAGGDAFLGGADFDAAIVTALEADFRQAHGIDLRGNTVVMQRLLFAAESAKVALSKNEKARLRVPCVAQKDGKFVDFQFELTRDWLDRVCEPLIEKSAGACDDLLARAGSSPAEVDELVLVGGQTRMPAVRRRFAREFKKFSNENEVHPDLAVAIGAAVLGRNLARGTAGLADVVPMPLSAMLPGGRTVEVIAANSTVPCSARLPIDALPVWNAPIPIALLEAVDQTSVEREAVGMVSIPPDWRKSQLKGKPQLELTVGQDFMLSAKLVSSTGEMINAPISDVRPSAPRR